MCAKTDYIIASRDFIFEDIDSIGVHSKAGKMHLAVYNTISQQIRNTVIVPSRSWGGSGVLGCKLSMGDEFTIPIPSSMK